MIARYFVATHVGEYPVSMEDGERCATNMARGYGPGTYKYPVVHGKAKVQSLLEVCSGDERQWPSRYKWKQSNIDLDATLARCKQLVCKHWLGAGDGAAARAIS